MGIVTLLSFHQTGTTDTIFKLSNVKELKYFSFCIMKD